MIGYKLAMYPKMSTVRGGPNKDYRVIRLSDDRTMLYTESRHYASVVVTELNRLHRAIQEKDEFVEYIISGGEHDIS